MINNKYKIIIRRFGTLVAVKPHRRTVVMKNFKRIYKLNLFAAIIFSFVLNSLAAEIGGKDAVMPKSRAASNYTVLVKDLSEKLKVDLSENNLQVNIKNVEKNRLANNLFEIKGQAFCVLPNDNTRLPINFEAKFNTAKQTLDDVRYVFVESEYAPVAEEEILMRELMKQVSRDYKTENIVIVIDAVEKVAGANDANKFLGVGEVRIGDMVWNKIKFDVVLDAQTGKANRVVYRVEK